MNYIHYEYCGNKIILKIKDRVCENEEELLSSKLFMSILTNCLEELKQRDSEFLNIFGSKNIGKKQISDLQNTLILLTKMNAELVSKALNESACFLKDKSLFNDFIEYLYNYWRSYDRFLICTAEDDDLEKRPYRIFNNTIEHLTHLIRATYRDIEENITGTHPRIYRQIRAGAEVAAIAAPHKLSLPSGPYQKLEDIPIIRQVLLYPPLILNPPMNKRTGVFEKISQNPLNKAPINKKDWLCYPAKVGELTIFIYFHKKFSELGYSLANLFELSDEKDLTKRPDAVYCFGVPKNSLKGLGKSQTVFYEDTKNKMFCAAVPNDDEFGYFGYLKKMVLTLHNIIMMKRGNLPFHGALVNIALNKPKKNVTILLIGDSGAGKSETLEAFRDIGQEQIKEMSILADDMGSLHIQKDKTILGKGTEIGAFLRLDDLKPGYAFGQMDRAIIMSPNKTNARIVLPVTSFQKLITGSKIDFILYANNYEEIDLDHPLIERITDASTALKVFQKGTVMSKGTTTATGLVHSYFANVFGPPQYRDLHDKLAARYFKHFFEKKIFVGEMRTRLGISGYERKGPQEAAKALLEIIKKPSG